MKIKLVVLLEIVFFFVTQAGFAQNTVIEKKRIVVSRSLSGHVEVGPMGAPEKNVTVELCSANWQTVLASTKTNDSGYFSMGAATGKLFYIRFSSPGNNTYQLRVRIKKHAAHDLKIHLSVAT